MSKLIIIRGPSGAGKSTVSKELMAKTKRPAVLIDLDYYRFIHVNGVGNHDLEYDMCVSNILIALDKGFDVIFDGNYNAKEKPDFFNKVLREHPNDNYFFYLDASLEETLKRHVTRADQRIRPEKMMELYKFASPTDYKDEVIIPESSSLEDTVNLIKKVSKGEHK